MSTILAVVAFAGIAVVIIVLGWMVFVGIGYLVDRRQREIGQIEAERAVTQARMQWATYRATEQMLKTARENMNRPRPGKCPGRGSTSHR